MNILGVHIGHDSSAALISDGHLIADVAEIPVDGKGKNKRSVALPAEFFSM